MQALANQLAHQAHYNRRAVRGDQHAQVRAAYPNTITESITNSMNDIAMHRKSKDNFLSNLYGQHEADLQVTQKKNSKSNSMSKLDKNKQY